MFDTILLFAENTKLVTDEVSPEWRYFELAENSNGVAFGLKSAHEVVLALDYKSPHLAAFEILLGAEQNTLTKLSLLKRGKFANRIDLLNQ